MSCASLDFDKQIWVVFSIGVISSVIILYFVKYGNMKNPTDQLLALILGFVILIYSFFSVLGYAKKQKIVQRIDDRSKELAEELDKIWYFRARWMGEIILIFIGIIYFIAFYQYWYILTLILLIAIVLCCCANCKARKK